MNEGRCGSSIPVHTIAPKEEEPEGRKLSIYLEYDLLVYHGVGPPSTTTVGSRLSRVKYTLYMSENTTVAKIPLLFAKAHPLCHIDKRIRQSTRNTPSCVRGRVDCKCNNRLMIQIPP